MKNPLFIDSKELAVRQDCIKPQTPSEQNKVGAFKQFIQKRLMLLEGHNRTYVVLGFP